MQNQKFSNFSLVFTHYLFSFLNFKRVYLFLRETILWVVWEKFVVLKQSDSESRKDKQDE